MQFSLHRKKSDGYQKTEHYPRETVTRIADHYQQILELLGEDPTREGLNQSPLRIAKAMQFMTQGYNMDPMVTFFQEMWCQEHNHQSAIDTHVHGNGSCMSVFYFLDMPVGACKMIIHDPRPAKVVTNLPMHDDTKISMGSDQVMFSPEVGTLVFAPPWLPHQFTRNNSVDPVRFVHMNLSVTPAPQPMVEVI